MDPLFVDYQGGGATQDVTVTINLRAIGAVLPAAASYPNNGCHVYAAGSGPIWLRMSREAFIADVQNHLSEAQGGGGHAGVAAGTSKRPAAIGQREGDDR